MEGNIVEIKNIEKETLNYQKIPRGSTEVAYVIFQSWNRLKYRIDTEKEMIYSDDFRNGKYDKIMIIKRRWSEEIFLKKIPCKENGHYFMVNLKVDFYIENPKYTYKHETYKLFEKLREWFFGLGINMRKIYSCSEQELLSDDLEMMIEDKLRLLPDMQCEFSLNIKRDDKRDTM